MKMCNSMIACVVYLNEKENNTCFVFFDKEDSVWNFILIWVERSISNFIKEKNIFGKLGNEQELIFISSKSKEDILARFNISVLAL